MEVLIIILLFNIVNVSEIVNPTRMNKMSLGRKDSSLRKVISRNNSEDSEEEKSGNRTTLTFSEMVGIYHDIWNAMLMGGGGKTTRIFPCISSVLKWKVPENSLEIQSCLVFLEFCLYFLSTFQREQSQWILRREERHEITRWNILHSPDSWWDWSISCPR